jgi:hypothetical protein
MVASAACFAAAASAAWCARAAMHISAHVVASSLSRLDKKVAYNRLA